MTISTTYNGWTNYETWLVALWLDNEQQSADYWRQEAIEQAGSDARPYGPGSYSDAAVGLAEALQEETEDLLEFGLTGVEDGRWTGLALDLVRAALSQVEWREIADNLLYSVAEERAERARRAVL